MNGVTTNYYWDGSKMVAMQTGNTLVWFYYSAGGKLIGMLYNGSQYYYVYDAQGNVTGIMDKNAQVVVRYSYDAWGRMGAVTGSMAKTVGTINPFRYRGYMYDTETGLYYLQSRYYNPVWGRFVNADTILGSNKDVSKYNLFVYCGNNPVMGSDPTGHEMSYGDYMNMNPIAQREYDEYRASQPHWSDPTPARKDAWRGSPNIVRVQSPWVSGTLPDQIQQAVSDLPKAQCFGLGITASAGAGIGGGSISLMYVLDIHGHGGILLTTMVTASTPQASICGTFMASWRQSVFDLQGISYNAGGSFSIYTGTFINSIGGDIYADSNGPCAASITVGIGESYPFDVHVGFGTSVYFPCY